MAVFDKWVVLKIVEFLLCVACLVAKRVSQDDEARLSLLLQKLSREWSLLTSVTWDSVGGAFADAIYGGYVIITFGLLLGRILQEIPKGRRILEGYFLGFGMLFFIILGGLELASLDSVPHSLVVNASVLGSLSLVVAALFLIDLMGPRMYTATHHSQTDPVTSPKTDKKVSILTPPQGVQLSEKEKSYFAKVNEKQDKDDKINTTNLKLTNEKITQNGTKEKLVQNSTNDKEKTTPIMKDKVKQNGKTYFERPDRPKDLDLEKGNTDKVAKKEESSIFDSPKHGYIKFDDDKFDDDIQESRFGSIRTGLNFEGGNYIRLSDPLSELHYEQELAKFNEAYFRKYLENVEGKFNVKEAYLPELQSPIFAKVKSGRLSSLYDDLSPTYFDKTRQSPTKSPSRIKTVPSPTLQQLEDYLKSSRTKRGDTPALFPMEPIEEKESTEGRASGTPSDRGYVQFTAGKWPEKRDLRTPRHSPTD